MQKTIAECMVSTAEDMLNAHVAPNAVTYGSLSQDKAPEWTERKYKDDKDYQKGQLFRDTSANKTIRKFECGRD